MGTLLIMVLSVFGFPPPSSLAQMGSQNLMCMPQPAACGFPDVGSTGVKPGAPLVQVNGNVTLSTPGQVYENKLVNGTITVKAPNVTIRNVKIVMNDFYGIRARTADPSNVDNLVVEDTEIDMGGQYGNNGIAFNHFTARRVFFHNGSDCGSLGDPDIANDHVVVEDSLCVIGPDDNDDGWPDSKSFCSGSSAHFDGFQSDGGNNLTMRHNTIRNPCSQTSAILMSTNTAPISNVVIDDNLVAGGGWTIYCGTTEGGVAANTRYTNNVISKQYFAKGGFYGPTSFCEHAAVNSGNVWDGTVRPPVGNPPGPGGTGPPAKVYRLSGKRARQLAKGALAAEFGRAFTNRAGRLSMGCARRSASKVACRVGWRGPRAAHAGARHRYTGRVVVRRVSVNRRAYSVRVRSWRIGCGCSHLIKRRGRL
jgi:hypothetical protein